MQIFRGSDQVTQEFQGAVICIGNFDGLHLGHQKLLSEAKGLGPEGDATIVIYSFEPHPVKVLRPELNFQTLFPRSDLAQTASKHGVGAIVLEEFNSSFAQLSASQFIKSILIDKLKPEAVVVGSNFRFGSQREGNIQLLSMELEKEKIRLVSVDPVFFDDEVISSSRIRSLISEGKVDDASTLLGRRFRIYGKVKHGDGRGKGMGSPTANISAKNEVLPGRGVFVTQLLWKEKLYDSVTNVGVRPSFKQGDDLVIETHVLDNDLDLYDAEVCLDFVKRLRDEKRFEKLEDLRSQIKKDISAARRILSHAKMD